MKETDLQRVIRRTIAAQGHGYAMKWATDLMVGVPDLVCALPNVGMFLCEVKYERDWFTNTTRTIKLSDHQRVVGRRFTAAGAPWVLSVVSDRTGGRFIYTTADPEISTLQCIDFDRAGFPFDPAGIISSLYAAVRPLTDPIYRRELPKDV